MDVARAIVASMHGAAEDEEDGVGTSAKGFIEAVHAKDSKAAAEHLRSLFQQFDAEPHEEGEHEEG